MTSAHTPYHAATSAVALADRSGRFLLRVGGPDRARFLHNLTTHDIKRLPPGQGREAFVTSPQGRTLGYVTILAGDSDILLRSDPGADATLLPHLRKYGLFDEVTLDDLSSESFEFHLSGPNSDDLAARLVASLPGEEDLSHALSEVAGRAVRVVRESPCGRRGLTLLGALADALLVLDAIRDAGAPLGLADLDPETFDALRIEAGTPVSGRDATAENLPQELGRDARTIDFVKGCYLGQETVARLDALGHVNKLLKGLHLDPGPLPPPGTSLEADGKTIGTITSSAFSPGWGHPIALGYVRVSHVRPGQTLALGSSDGRLVTVSDLPMIPPGA